MIMTRVSSNHLKAWLFVLFFYYFNNGSEAWIPMERRFFPQQSLTRRTTTTTRLYQKASSMMEPRDDSSSIRRNLLLQTLFLIPSVSVAADAESTASSIDSDGGNIMTAVASFLQEIPTYCIVDDAGVPFMVVGEDAIVTGYFFTTYAEAQRLLSLASRATDRAIQESKKDQENDVLVNPWKSARVSTVPLSTAVAIVTKSVTRQLGRSNVFLLAPAETNVEEALAVTGQQELQEGKVPLFYMQNFTISEKKTDNAKQPLYFTKTQLLQAASGRDKEDPVEVTELLSVLRAMAEDPSLLDTLVLVPPPGSVKKAQQLSKDKRPPFLLGERNLIL